MSINHGGPITLKPINEIAEYIKNMIPANIPETYTLKARFANVADEENIRKGVAAFRDFLYLFCDRLISEGDLYFKLPQNPKSNKDYPFLYNIADLLADIGYYGHLAKNGDSILITELPSFTATVDENGKRKLPKNSAAKLKECVHFLTLCGFVFTGNNAEVSYPEAPLLMTGLKALAIADMELRVKRYISDKNHDNLLRCDYRLIKAEDTDALDVLKDFVHLLPEEVQKFAMEIHQRYTDMGMTCVPMISTFEVHFAYSDIKNSKRVLSLKDMYQLRAWELALSTKYGYCLVVRAKRTDKYADVIEQFPLSLQEKIARGYGCDRKRNEPCQGGCQGVRISLDDSILDISGDILIWLDNEVSYL